MGGKKKFFEGNEESLAKISPVGKGDHWRRPIKVEKN